jgi:hypothetical protein
MSYMRKVKNILKISGFRNVIILIRFGSLRFTNISFRSVSFHDFIIFLTSVSFRFRIISFRFVTFHDLVFFVSFQKIMRFLRFVPFRFVPKLCILILVHHICKPAFYQSFRSSCSVVR